MKFLETITFLGDDILVAIDRIRYKHEISIR